jgi:hypothetical protein
LDQPQAVVFRFVEAVKLYHPGQWGIQVSKYKSKPPAVSMRLQAVEKKRIADRQMPKNQQNGLFWIELLQRREARL